MPERAAGGAAGAEPQLAAPRGGAASRSALRRRALALSRLRHANALGAALDAHTATCSCGSGFWVLGAGFRFAVPGSGSAFQVLGSGVCRVPADLVRTGSRSAFQRSSPDRERALVPPGVIGRSRYRNPDGDGGRGRRQRHEPAEHARRRPRVRCWMRQERCAPSPRAPPCTASSSTRAAQRQRPPWRSARHQPRPPASRRRDTHRTPLPASAAASCPASCPGSRSLPIGSLFI